MSERLKVLADNRDNILLAEIGAMIHNIGKMSEEHLISQDFNLHLYFGDWLYDLLIGNPGLQSDNNWKSHWDLAQKAQGKFYPQSLKTLLSNLKISFPTAPLNDRLYELREFSSTIIKDLYKEQSEQPILDKALEGKTSRLSKMLEVAHSRSVGGDKGFTLKTNINQQERNFIHLSSAFGYEAGNISKKNINIEKDCFLFNLQSLLQKVNDFFDQKKSGKTDSQKELEFWTAFHPEFHQMLKKHISPYIADTRYPINDVDLYSFHHSTASFYKAGIAKILLEQPANLEYNDIEKFEWKMLSVRYNGLDYLTQARSVNDILGKQQALKNTLDTIKSLLEIEYPIANEVYRDENGSVFLFPTLEGIEKAVKKEIVEKIEGVFKKELQNELKPEIHLSDSSRQALKLGEAISEYTPKFNQFYPDLDAGQSNRVDLCHSCNLRFIGHGLSGIALRKAVARKICGVCYERRETRARNWWEQENDKTIWMDEVADDVGQVALIAGKFDMKNWLNGWWLNSMLVKTFRELIERKPSLFSDYKNDLKRNVRDWINRTFQSKSTAELRQDISNTIGTINNLVDSFAVEDIIKSSEKLDKMHKELNKTIESLKETFSSSGISISDTKQFLTLGEFLKSKISISFPDSIAPYLNFDPGKAFTNLGEFDYYLQNERDAWHIYNADDDHRFFFVNGKPASFARINRIWHQTREFNQNIPSLVESCMSALKRQRLIIKATDESNVGVGSKSFTATHVYDFNLGKVPLSFYCIKGSENDNRQLEFVSAINWDYLQKQLQFDWQKKLTKGTLLKETAEKRLNLQIKIESVKKVDKTYYPCVPILAGPQLFMFLVPASYAVEIISMIKKQYDEQFSKAKNRLPFNIAVVFAKRKQPLYTILEAGRKMLDGFDNNPLCWQVQDDASFDEASKKTTLRLKAKRHENETDGYNLRWKVSSRLGDPAKTDFYYPYFYTDHTQDTQIGIRTDVFKAPLLNNNSDWRYVCHVSELKKGDSVYVTPSFFDFEFLEVPGRRFDLYYENSIRSLRNSKPFLLEELHKLEKTWQLISNGGLINAQFRGLLDVIEDKRETWLHTADPDDTFKNFVEHTIHAQAKDWYSDLNDEDRDLILEFAINGRLLDVFELYMKLLKRRLKEE